MLQQLSQSQRDFICLWFIVQHSLSSFKVLDYYGSVPRLLRHGIDWAILNLHSSHLKRVQEF